MQLTFVWWNTALSPTKNQNRASEEELIIASTMLRYFSSDNVDVIVLCEVSDADVDFLIEYGDVEEYGIVRAMNRAGRGIFDVCLMHRRDTVALSDLTDLVISVNDANIRLGQRFELQLANDVKPLYLFASHWPSVATLSQHHPDRFRLGDRLRICVDEVLKSDQRANIILMGDYNDEPFDYSVSANLLASRDSQFVSERCNLLYNPFWRHLSSFDHGGDSKLTDRGTYFHRGGTVHRWRTFDHMMFSSALTTGVNGWLLDEHAARVVDAPLYTDLVSERKYIFDHLPIVCRLVRKDIP